MRTHIHRTASAIALLSVIALVTLPALASIEKANPEDVGLSSERLGRIHEAIQRHIDEGNITGAVTAVSRRGRLAHLESHGLMDVESTTAMRDDAIFKIMSMTKPVVGVAVLMLVEEGKVRLRDPVSRFIPELGDLEVAVAMPGRGGRGGRGGGDGPPPFYTVPASRDITVQDLLTHTSGLASGPFSNREAGRVGRQEPSDTLADLIPRLGEAPLEFQPGDRWAYSASRGFDVLLRIVEVASGLPADQFLRERIFGPLGMEDTSFWARESVLPRVVTVYQRTPNGLTRSQSQTGATSQTYFSGGGGLVSTATDYLQFGQMLLNGGELNGTRLLGPKTVELMSSTIVEEFGFGQPSPGLGFGLSVQVVKDPVAAGYRVGTGSFGWDGAYGTHFWIDPVEEIVGVVMIQTPVFQVSRDVENALMQAVLD
jgi:CubicO group peptidase (beta-lactamase class C family)